MNMRKKILTLGLMAVVVAAWAAPSFAARPIQGTVGEVTAADAAALGQVGFRVWSAMVGGESNVNDNVSSCRNVRCLRNFVANASLAAPGAPGGGGYVGNQEATQVYNGDIPDQPFYMLADANMATGGGNHIGFWGVTGVTANNSGVGSHLTQDCGTVGAQNCFGRIDLNDSPAVLANTKHSYGGSPNTIRGIGGLSPIPNVRVGGVAAGAAQLSWQDPPSYAGNMRPSNTGGAPVSPVRGVRLYKNDRSPCTDPPENDPGWTPLGDHALGDTTALDILPSIPGGCRYYALRVRVTGPGGDTNEVETAVVGVNSQAVSLDPTAVRITRFSAQYAGHGVVNVTWQSGVEGGLRGFRVTRGATANGPFAPVSDLVPAAGDGHNYSYSDAVKAGAGKTYYYQLQIVGADGNISTSTPAAITLPGRTKKTGPKIR